MAAIMDVREVTVGDTITYFTEKGKKTEKVTSVDNMRCLHHTHINSGCWDNGTKVIVEV